jgi:O-antigen/teichoic acid export membrane protein
MPAWSAARTKETQLYASVVLNFIARLPAIFVLFYILPAINKGLGPNLYGEFLSMLALGSMLTLFFGGINAVGRRRLSAAHSVGDKGQEAAAASETVISAALVTCAAVAAATLVASRYASDRSLIFVSIFPILAAFANTFDNLRAAYNQHYVTAGLQTIAQLLVFGTVELTGTIPGGPIASAAILQLPSVLASLTTFAWLLVERPWLISTSVQINIPGVFKSAVYVTMADGAVFAALNASVFGLTAMGATDIAAWYGTLTRAFQTLLAPTILILFPLSSFIAVRWRDWTAERRSEAMNMIVLASGGYGLAVAVIISLGANEYLQIFFPTIPRYALSSLSLVAIFFGTIVMLKVYTQLIYAIFEARRLSLSIFSALCFGLVSAAASRARFDAMAVLEVLAVCASFPITISVLTDHIARQATLRISPIESRPAPWRRNMQILLKINELINARAPAFKPLIRAILPSKLRTAFVKAKFEATIEGGGYIQTFENIHSKNWWGSAESVSGYGSQLSRTVTLRRELVKWLGVNQIGSMLDAPCGDYNWMREVVDRSHIQYIGGDIVASIIEHNTSTYSDGKRVAFSRFDVLEDALPNVDFWLCRDLLFHFPNSAIEKVLARAAESNIRFFGASHFKDTQKHGDISFGGYRPVNLCKSPFNWPEPSFLIFDGDDGAAQDRYLGIWRIEDISPRVDR